MALPWCRGNCNIWLVIRNIWSRIRGWRFKRKSLVRITHPAFVLSHFVIKYLFLCDWRYYKVRHAALFIPKCDEGVLQSATAILLQSVFEVITQYDRYYKVWLRLLQSATVHVCRASCAGHALLILSYSLAIIRVLLQVSVEGCWTLPSSTHVLFEWTIGADVWQCPVHTITDQEHWYKRI